MPDVRGLVPGGRLLGGLRATRSPTFQVVTAFYFDIFDSDHVGLVMLQYIRLRTRGTRSASVFHAKNT